MGPTEKIVAVSVFRSISACTQAVREVVSRPCVILTASFDPAGILSDGKRLSSLRPAKSGKMLLRSSLGRFGTGSTRSESAKDGTKVESGERLGTRSLILVSMGVRLTFGAS